MNKPKEERNVIIWVTIWSLVAFVIYTCVMWSIQYVPYVEAIYCDWSGSTCTGSGGKIAGADWDNARTVATNHPKCAIVENLAAADDNIEVFIASIPGTITAVGCHCRGTCTTKAEISLEDRAGNAMTHTTPTCSETTGTTTYQTVTAANSLISGEGLAFDVDNAVSPETDTYSICFYVERG